MKHFRIKQYYTDGIYCLQIRTGLFSWKTIDVNVNKEFLENRLSFILEDIYAYHPVQIVEYTSKNDVFILIPTIVYQNKTIGIGLFNFFVSINL